jgi:hypothetical protein
MKRAAYFSIMIFLAFNVVSCASKQYLIATDNKVVSDYRVIEVRDSSLLVIPWKYNYELRPEIIRENSEVIPFNSITKIERASSSGVQETISGFFLGIPTGFFAGVSLTKVDHGNLSGPINGMFIGALSGAIIGYLLHPHEKNMIPISDHLNEIRLDAKYSH